MQTGSLYVNDNGMICCVEHGGSYLASAYQRKPEQCCYGTPLDSWEKVDGEYVAEWTVLVGSAPVCEMCS